jgi:hypothetical protein
VENDVREVVRNHSEDLLISVIKPKQSDKHVNGSKHPKEHFGSIHAPKPCPESNQACDKMDQVVSWVYMEIAAKHAVWGK